MHNLWQVVQNVYFAKSEEKPHGKSIFKHFGQLAPDLRKQNPARIRFRITQNIILHGEPAFLKQSPLGWCQSSWKMMKDSSCFLVPNITVPVSVMDWLIIDGQGSTKLLSVLSEKLPLLTETFPENCFCNRNQSQREVSVTLEKKVFLLL